MAVCAVLAAGGPGPVAEMNSGSSVRAAGSPGPVAAIVRGRGAGEELAW
jgi:hypothetical protein